MNDSILFSIYFVWVTTIIYFLLKAILNCRKPRIKNSYQKKFEANNKSKQVFKYLCEVILRRPNATDFDSSLCELNIELIYQEPTSPKVKFARFNMKYRDGQCNLDICCDSESRAFFMIFRNSPLPPITHMRAIHNSSKEIEIFMKGIEINDQMSGHRLYFVVNSYIMNTIMNEAVVHLVKPMNLEFFSKQTFCPDFHILNIETYGENIQIAKESSNEEINGIRLLPKLNWFEEFLFNALLIHLLLAFIVAILFAFKDSDDFPKSLASIVLSGIISPSVVQLVSFSYRVVVKKGYNSNCSPMKIESNDSSVFWMIFRYLYLFTVFFLTVLIPILALILIQEDLKLKYKLFNNSRNPEILIILFILSLIIVYTFWLFLFAIIRFLFRICCKPNPVVLEFVGTDLNKLSSTYSVASQVKEKSDIERGLSSPSPRSKVEDNIEKIEKSERSENVKSAKDKKKKNKGKLKEKDTEDEDSYSELSKKNASLSTGSFIVAPTKSLGFIDPKVFKLSESDIDLSKEMKDNDKKK